jgi:phage terminase large subunit-like protein
MFLCYIEKFHAQTVTRSWQIPQNPKDVHLTRSTARNARAKWMTRWSAAIAPP